MTAPRPALASAPAAPPSWKFVASDTFASPDDVPHAVLLASARDCLGALESLEEKDRVGAELESLAFRLYNWLKQRSSLLAHSRRQVAESVDDETRASLEAAALAVRNELASKFLPLVIGTARKIHGSEAYSNDELVSELAETLLGVIENFDVDRGFRFSTYATLALRRQMIRLLRVAASQRQAGQSLEADRAEASPGESEQAAQYKWDVSQQLIQLIEGLEPRERVILRARLGIDTESARRPSLRRLGERLGLSRERIRQLEQQALRRIRAAASQRNISLTP